MASSSDAETEATPQTHEQFLAPSWEEEVPELEMEMGKLDVKSFNDALRQSSQPYFEKPSGYLPPARNSASMSEDEILQKINVSKILGDDDTDSGDITFDMLIPTDKVGLVIGKGGKNIKALQEKSGARMNVIQHSNTYDEYDKTLRMIGPPDLVQHARHLVHELINRVPDPNATKYSLSPTESYQPNPSASFKTIRYPVPKISVGLIIGRGGETIKKIRTETGAKVQFDPVNNALEDLDEQVATVTGKPEQIRAACGMIQELVRTALKGPRATSRKPFHEETNFKPYNPSDAKYANTDAKPRPSLRQVIKKHISIPADKANVFQSHPNILEDISSQTGVYCCIDRSDADLPSETAEIVFVLRGHPRQVDIASELIMKKVRSPPAHPPKNNKPYYRAQEHSGDFEPKNNEWGQGDPSAPWGMQMQNPAASRTQDHNSNKGMHSFSHSQWLEYFQPERQQAQADAWERKVKAEEGSSLAKSLSSPANEISDVCSPESYPEDQSEQHLLSKLHPLTEQWSQEPQDCPQDSEALPGSYSNNKDTQELVTPEIPCEGPVAHAHAPSADANVFNPAIPYQGLPQFGPSTRVVTLYYDINSNSVVVLNQYNYA